MPGNAILPWTACRADCSRRMRFPETAFQPLVPLHACGYSLLTHCVKHVTFDLSESIRNGGARWWKFDESLWNQRECVGGLKGGSSLHRVNSAWNTREMMGHAAWAGCPGNTTLDLAMRCRSCVAWADLEAWTGFARVYINVRRRRRYIPYS